MNFALIFGACTNLHPGPARFLQHGLVRGRFIEKERKKWVTSNWGLKESLKRRSKAFYINTDML